MGKKKVATLQPDQKAWEWALKFDFHELTEDQLRTAYRLTEAPCKIHFCRSVKC